MPGMLMMRPPTATRPRVPTRLRRADRPPHHLRALPPGCPQPRRHLQEGVAKGAYVVAGPAAGEDVDCIIIGTGTELELAVKAAEELGEKARAVSMPCWELFEEQSDEYKESILPKSCKAIVSIEAGSTFGWSKYADISIGRDDFGASAPAGILYKEFGITTEAAVKAAKSLM